MDQHDQAAIDDLFNQIDALHTRHAEKDRQLDALIELATRHGASKDEIERIVAPASKSAYADHVAQHGDAT